MPAPPGNAYSDPSFIEIQRLEASAWLAHAAKQDDEAVRLMRSAVDIEKSTLATWFPAPLAPALEQLGDLFLGANKPANALPAYESSMVATPNRFNGLFGAARAAERSGDLEKAKVYYARLVDNCKGSEGDRAELIGAGHPHLEKRALAGTPQRRRRSGSADKRRSARRAGFEDDRGSAIVDGEVAWIVGRRA